mmetsp:Transcript_14747/g.33378  ORF Transcript_14747/g.33378 Transcript_14747/m.33378 type:complete len:271 (-) Transcript_14747:101-913(-)
MFAAHVEALQRSQMRAEALLGNLVLCALELLEELVQGDVALQNLAAEGTGNLAILGVNDGLALVVDRLNVGLGLCGEGRGLRLHPVEVLPRLKQGALVGRLQLGQRLLDDSLGLCSDLERILQPALRLFQDGDRCGEALHLSALQARQRLHTLGHLLREGLQGLHLRRGLARDRSCLLALARFDVRTLLSQLLLGKLGLRLRELLLGGINGRQVGRDRRLALCQLRTSLCSGGSLAASLRELTLLGPQEDQSLPHVLGSLLDALVHFLAE